MVEIHTGNFLSILPAHKKRADEKHQLFFRVTQLSFWLNV